MKKPDHPCPVRQVRADTIDDLVMSIVREAARDPKLIEDAVAEANRLAREQVDPLRQRVEQLRREQGEAEDQAARVLTQILSAGIAASATAKRLLADAEDRQSKLRTSLAQAEGELATRETQHLDHEAMIAAIQGACPSTASGGRAPSARAASRAHPGRSAPRDRSRGGADRGVRRRYGLRARRA